LTKISASVGANLGWNHAQQKQHNLKDEEKPAWVFLFDLENMEVN